MYKKGHSYAEISAVTGLNRPYLYATVHREVRSGKMDSQRDPEVALRNGILGSVRMGGLRTELEKLTTEEMSKVASKIKANESIAEALIRLALRR